MPEGRHVPIALWLWFAVLLALPLTVRAGTVQYVYDELGRLVAAIDPDGDTTEYVYDDVGNLLAISRRPSAPVSIVAFTPVRGRFGTSVTLFGTGFSPSPAANAVRFGGTLAPVTSATATALVTRVPAGATSGPITVVTPLGAGTSAAPFEVLAPQPPEIASFSPEVAAPESTVEILGSGFEPVPGDNAVTVNTTGAGVVSADALTLAVRVPTASGGKLQVTTPHGAASSTEDLFIVLPPHAVADVGDRGRIEIDGPRRALSLGTGELGLLLFDGSAGTAGARVNVGNVSAGMVGTVTVYGTGGATLGSPTVFGAAGATVNLPTLPATGTYTVLLASSGASGGSATVGVATAANSWVNPAGGLWHDPANWSGGVVPGSSDVATIKLPGSYTVVVDRSTTVSGVVLGAATGTQTLWIRGSQSSGHVTFTSTGTFLNAAVVRLESIDAAYTSSLAGNVTTEATGRVEVNQGSGGARRLSGTWVNRGTVRVGSKLGEVPGGFTNEGEFEVLTGGLIETSGASAVFNQNGGRMSGSGLLQVLSGATLNFNGGTVTGEPPVVVGNGKLNFGASTEPAIFAMGGTGGVVGGTIAAGQTLWIRGSAAFNHASATTSGAGLVSRGVIRLQSVDAAYSSSLGGNATTEATGLIEVNQGSGGARRLSGTWVNRGTVRVGSNLGEIPGGFTNEGEFEVLTGGLMETSGASAVFNQNGGRMSGSGLLQVLSGATLNFNGGTVTGEPPVVVGNGKLNFGASTEPAIFAMGGTGGVVGGTIAAGQTLWIRGSAAFNHASATTSGAGLVSRGVIRLQSVDAAYSSSLGGNATTEATGLIEVNQGSGGARRLSGTWVNRGTVRVGSNLGEILGGFTNEGEFEVLTGGEIGTSGASAVFNQNGGRMSGSGLLQVLSGATLNFNGGTVTGEPPVVVGNGKLNFGASTEPAIFAMGGTGGVVGGTIAAGQTLWIRGSAAFNHASATTSGAGLVSRGVIRLQSVDAAYSSSLGGNATTEATGLIEVNQGSGGARRLSGTWVNRGTVRVGSNLGEILGGFTNEGEFEVLTGGEMETSGTSAFFNQNGGRMSGSGLLQVLSGATLNFNGGTVTGEPPVVVGNGKLNFGASTEPAIFAMGGTGGVVGGTIAAGQTLWIRGSAAFSHTSATTSGAGLVNRGVIRLESINSGYTSSLGGVVTSEATGLIEVNQGTGGTRTFTGTLTNRGTLQVKTSFTVAGTAFQNALGGSLQGTGTVTLSTVTLGNAGSIRPGSSPGILTVAGSVAQAATGSLDVEIGGKTVGSLYDQLRVAGNVSLGGALNITLLGGFEPAIGDSFEILTYASRTGSFESVNGLAIGTGKRFSLSYGTDRALLSVVPE